jgi:integrase
MDITKTQTDEKRPQVELPIPPVSNTSKSLLEPRGEMILSDYRTFKRDFLNWCLTVGKNTYKKRGYAESTVEHTHYKVEESYQWKWERHDEYTTEFSPDDATDLLEFMVRHTSHPDRYVYSFEKSLRRLFKFLRDERGRSIPEWEHDVPLSPSEGSREYIKDKFYPEEMAALYEAALAEYSLPNLYSPSITSEEREELKTLVSQRYGISKDDLDRETFNDASSWKVPSIVAVTADTGLRPIEVGRAKASWFDTDQGEMVVPAEEATKNREYWNCTLSTKSINAVEHWLSEREKYDMYRNEPGMWLTRNGNPYCSRSLNKVLDKLMDRTDISQRNRNLSWYSFRHGAATAWIEAEGLSRAKNQLRHKSIVTTQKYKREGGDRTGGGDSFW